MASGCSSIGCGGALDLLPPAIEHGRQIDNPADSRDEGTERPAPICMVPSEKPRKRSRVREEETDGTNMGEEEMKPLDRLERSRAMAKTEMDQG